jgi:hypothetical protein
MRASSPLRVVSRLKKPHLADRPPNLSSPMNYYPAGIPRVYALACIALLLGAPRPGWSQRAPAATDTATTTTNSTSPAKEDIVSMSPFEVVSDTKGYYETNSMSGTRFNSKIEDMASSITVMTKQQMQDFAMLDINDVFLYTAGAEGTGTYTDYVMDRNGQLTDNVQNNPTGANRMRGISSVNISYGNYQTQGRVPLDPLTIEGVEISRGPNANVFGLGNASGTVNQVPVSANLSRDFTRAELRADSYDGYRSTLDINRVLKKNVLSFRVNGGFQHEGFTRKPSGVNTVRYDAMVKFQPFRKTTISASWLHYRMNGNRPNYTPPRDYVSYWLASGKPSWDPILQVVHVNGQTIGNGGLGTTTPITADASVPDYFTRAGTIQTRGNLYVDQYGVAYWTAPNTVNPASVPFTPAANNQTVRLMQTSAGAGTNGATVGRIGNQPLFTTTPSVSSKDIYDWSDINLSAVNRLMDKTETYNVSLDQLFFNTPRQTLAAQIGFFREDSQRYKRTPIGDSGTSGQTGQLFIDPNERLLDGSPNPFFGRPYIGVTEPVDRWTPSKWDTYRAQLAYKLDFRDDRNLLKYLGLQQFSAYDEYKYQVTRQYAYRDVLASDLSWTQTGLTGFAANQYRAVQSNVTGGPQAGANIVRQYYRYYVGDSSGGNVDYAPSTYKYSQYPFVWGGYTITNGVPSNAGTFVRDPATLAQWATTDQTGGNNNLKQIIKTPGAVLQSHFLDDRIVTTLGIREDKVYSKFGAVPQLSADKTEHDFVNDNHWADGDYRFNSGKTKTYQIVARPLRDIPYLRNAVDHGSAFTRFVAEVVRNAEVYYNKSDNFIPQAPAVDLYLKPLPNVTGQGKDYGLWLTMFDNRLSVKINRYDNKQLNARDNDANTVAQRVLRLDLDISSDAYQLYDRADAWFRLINPTWNDTQVRQAVADQMQIPIATYDALVSAFRAGTVAATNDVQAKGTEVEINYNPTKFWTMVASGTEQKSISSNISSAVQQWIDQRMPVWTTIVDPNTNPSLGTGQSQGWVAAADNPNHLWWLHNYGGSQTAAQNYASFVDAPYRVIKQQEGKSKPSLRKYAFKFSTMYQLAGITENRILRNVKLGGSLRWEDKGAIGYYGKQSLPAVITELDANNPIYDKAHTYVDLVASYRTRMWANRVGTTFQLNVRNVQESGRLQPIGAFPDGTPNAYRIVDPRQFIFTVTFDL